MAVRCYGLCFECSAPMVPTKLGDKPSGYVHYDNTVYVQCSDPSCGSRAGHRHVLDYVVVTPKGKIKR